MSWTPPWQNPSPSWAALEKSIHASSASLVPSMSGRVGQASSASLVPSVSGHASSASLVPSTSRHVGHASSGDAGMSMLPSTSSSGVYDILKAQTYMFFLHGMTVSDVYHPYPTEFTKIDYFAPKGTCPDQSHANMLHRFTSRAQMTANMHLFMNGSEQCVANGTTAMLQPILFASWGKARVDDTTAHIGLFRYDFMGTKDDDRIYDVKMKRLKTYDDFDSEKLYTYSELFKMVSDSLKPKIKRGQTIDPDKLHIIFFCCRNPSAPVPPLQITPLPTGVIISSEKSINAYLPSLPNIQLLEHSMVISPPQTTQPLGRHPSMQKHMTHQSCLLNLFAFYGIIPYDQANVIASMLGFQQRHDLTSNKIVVAGESVRYFLNVIDSVLLPRGIDRRYIVERMSVRDGLQKIWDNLRAVGQSRTHHAWFIKMYPTDLKPGTPDTLSEMGHWVSFWITPNGVISFVDPQGLPLHGASSTSFVMANTGPVVDSQPVMAYLIATYRTADIIYVLTPNAPNPPAKYLTGITYRRDQLGPARRLPKGGRKNWSRKCKATANAKTRCKKRT